MDKPDADQHGPRRQRISPDMADFLLPGIIIEPSPETADQWGAFEEDALNETDAWDANGDPMSE